MQHHLLFNVTKKQAVAGHHIECGLTIHEQTGGDNTRRTTANALFLLCANSNARQSGGDLPHHPLIGSWAGDQIVVQGDEAKKGDPGFLETTSGYKNISKQVVEMFDTVFAG